MRALYYYMEATLKELATAIAISELYRAPIVQFLPVKSTYTKSLGIMRRKKYVEKGSTNNWILTDKGRLKFLNEIAPDNKALEERFKQVEDFVNNL